MQGRSQAVSRHHSKSTSRGISASAAAAASDVITHEALDIQRVPALSVRVLTRCQTGVMRLTGGDLQLCSPDSLWTGQDNYVWILTDHSSGKVAVVDPSEARPVVAALQQRWACPAPGQLPLSWTTGFVAACVCFMLL